jgi:alanine racemase
MPDRDSLYQAETRAVLEISLGAIRNNIKLIRQLTGTTVMAVVKADAYGHGLVSVARAALEAGAEWLGTALLSEALALRGAGVTNCRLIAWITPPNDCFEAAIGQNVDLSVSSVEILREIVAAGKRIGRVPRVHLEIDTGMTRGGVLLERPQLIQEIHNGVVCNELEFVGIWSHFACADEPTHEMMDRQESAFQRAVENVRAIGLTSGILHLANSAAALTRPSSRLDLVRIGIGMYGLCPLRPGVQCIGISDLIPAMTMKARLFLVKKVPKGTSVGYGAASMTQRETYVGLVPLGYADGIPRNTNSQAFVLAGSYQAPVIGRVSMDQFVVDLGVDSTAKAGDWITVFGGSEPNAPSVNDWAAANQTINYEIVTRLSSRIARLYCA